jgi:hypothetical protein
MTTATYTFDENIVSDLHKDAYGFRPCQNWWADWGSMNNVGKQQEWDSMIDAMERREASRKEAERASIVVFEHNVTTTIANGAKDRATAIRWLMDASTANGDVEFFEYLMGIPYGYVSGKNFG